jgi:hypothetical protein
MCRWEDNNKVTLIEIIYDSLDLIYVARCRTKLWRVLLCCV